MKRCASKYQRPHTYLDICSLPLLPPSTLSVRPLVFVLPDLAAAVSVAVPIVVYDEVVVLA